MSDQDPVELTELSRTLLRRAREGDPAPAELEELRRAVLAKMGPGGGSGGTPASRPRSPVLIAAGAAGVIALLVGGYVGVGALTARPEQDTASVIEPSASPRSASRASEVAPSPGSVPPQVAPDQRALARAHTARDETARRDEGDARDEAAYVESIRRALETDATRALRLARRHRALFPDGLLGEEAEALEVESLARLGRGEQAASRARDFFERHPSSPYRRRLERAMAAPAESPSVQ